MTQPKLINLELCLL